MSIFHIFISAFIVGLSGAMMPGSLLTYNINSTMRQGFRAGPLLIIGHSLLEFALIILILLGFISWPIPILRQYWELLAVLCWSG